MEAVQLYPEAVLRLASEELRVDHGIVQAAVTSSGDVLRRASEELRADPSIVLEAVKQDPASLKWAVVGGVFTDPDFVLTAVRLNVPRAFERA